MNEITVKINCSIKEMITILEDKGFEIIDKYSMDDIYYIPENINIHGLSVTEILNFCLLLRNIKQYEPKQFINSHNIIKITYKNKNIASNGDIISQEKYDCEIKDLQQGKELLKAIKYKELMNIREDDIVYEKAGLEISIKDIEDGENLIEIELNEKFDSIDKVKQKINEINIPIDKSNFFVKKAEIELKKVLEIYND
jgi:adenylate cyclase class IV